MRRDGIRCALDAIKCEADAFALSFLRYPRIELARALEGAELRRAVCGARHPLRRHAGIELEWKPADRGADLAVERRDRLLQAALADVAPRTDDIRNHFDGQRSTHVPECSEK